MEWKLTSRELTPPSVLQVRLAGPRAVVPPFEIVSYVEARLKKKGRSGLDQLSELGESKGKVEGLGDQPPEPPAEGCVPPSILANPRWPGWRRRSGLGSRR